MFSVNTSQIVVNGNASRAEIVKAFGVSSIIVKQCVKKYRERGARIFFRQVLAHQHSG